MGRNYKHKIVKRSTIKPTPHQLMMADKVERAFWAYFELGENRSVENLAKKLGKSVHTLRKWSAKGRWSERISLIAERIRREHENEVVRASQQVLEQAKNIAQVVIAELLERFRELKNQGMTEFSYKDLKDFLTLQLQMHGFLGNTNASTNINVIQQTNPLQVNANIDGIATIRKLLKAVDPEVREKIIDAMEKIESTDLYEQSDTESTQNTTEDTEETK